MDRAQIRALLEKVEKGSLSVEEALEKLRHFPVQDLGHTQIDTHRALRRGFPEVIFCQGKKSEQIEVIVERMAESGSQVLATRCPAEVARSIVGKVPGARYHPLSGALVVGDKKKSLKGGLVLVVSAGTSDIPVAEEAAVTAETLGCRVQTLYDAGVAGIHRLLRQSKLLTEAAVIIVVAGMEGALPSVVGGLVEAPVIAVPTSVGYGASFGGLAALLAMLNSCSPGVLVVNIDNGFGAGYAATLIVQSVGRKSG